MSTLVNTRRLAAWIGDHPHLAEPLSIVVHDPSTEGAAIVVHLPMVGDANPAEGALAWMRALDNSRPFVTHGEYLAHIDICGYYAPQCLMVVKTSLYGEQAAALRKLAPANDDQQTGITPALLEQIAQLPEGSQERAA